MAAWYNVYMSERKNPFEDTKPTIHTSIDEPKPAPPAPPAVPPVKTDDSDWNKIINAPDAMTDDEFKPVENKERKKFFIVLAIVVAICLAMATGVYFGVKSTLDNRNAYNAEQQAKVKNSAPKPKTEKKKATTSSALVNPTSTVTAIADAPNGSVHLDVNGKNVTFVNPDKTSAALSFPALSNIKATRAGCDLGKDNANCFIGVSTVGSSTVNLFAFRNAKTSSLLYSEDKTNSLPTNGAAYVFTRPSDNNTTDLYIVLSNQNGLVLESSDANLIHKIATDSMDHFTLTESNK